MSIHYKPSLGRGYTNPKSGQPGLSSTLRQLQEEVGAYVKQRREAKEITQAVLGKILGVGNTHISSIETGQRKISPEMYLAYAKALDLDREDFGKRLLLAYDPFTYQMLFPGRKVNEILARVPTRITGWEETS
jgi:transcriptional regulator with XRE-family HTH domain